jgi:predicted nucleic acid-binding Zn ribbon protein
MDDQTPGGTAGDSGGAPTRVCPHCATISQTSGDFCPQCGKSYVKRRRFSKRARIWSAGIVVLLAVIVVAGLVIKSNDDSTVARHHREAVKRAEVVARKSREQKEATERREAKEEKEKEETKHRIEVLVRKDAEHELEKTVSKDAKSRVDEGELEGPILHTSCVPLSGGSSEDLSSSKGDFNCLAVTKVEDGEEEGYRFTATLNFKSGEMTWRLGS